MKILTRSIAVRGAIVYALALVSHNAVAEPVLALRTTVELPKVTGGDFDHFAVDIAHNRLFVSAEKYGSIEVFALASGDHLSSVKGIVASPHKLVFVPDRNELFVADTTDGSCKVLDARDLHVIKRIALGPHPDAGVYDPASRIFYVGHQAEEASGMSYIAMISVDQQQVIGRIPIKAAVLKAMVIDPKAGRLYVNMRDKKQIGVIDLKSRSIVATWSVPGLNGNSAMASDSKNHRLFVGSRGPGKLFILDSNNGTVVSVLNTVDTSDDITFDAADRRLYVSGSDGVDVMAQITADHYRVIQHVDTLGGKTSVYVPALNQFYVVHTRGDLAQEAGLQVFKVNHSYSAR
jgi:DNA-binding beta-propeller fold protein YncE